MTDITQILSEIESGNRRAAEELLPAVYDELRRLAASRMAGERSDHTLQATALVHEAYLRLVGGDSVKKWDSRGHFFSAASEAMRRILVEAARARSTQKRSSPGREELSRLHPSASISDQHLLEISDALEELEKIEPQVVQLVKQRFFGGFSMQEIADSQGISVRKAHYLWDFGRSWLQSQISDADFTEIAL